MMWMVWMVGGGGLGWVALSNREGCGMRDGDDVMGNINRRIKNG